MELEKLQTRFTICKLPPDAPVDLSGRFRFVGRTDEELSLVCPTEDAPDNTIAREDGWRGFRIRGTLDFSLVGILAKLSSTLSDGGIGLFAVSTYNTDYVFVKEESFTRALDLLSRDGWKLA